MKHFEPKTSTNGFRYISTEMGSGILIDAYYYKDGTPRGLFLSVHQCEQKLETGHGVPYTSLVVEITSGFLRSVLPLERKSPKSLGAFAGFMDEHLPEIARKFVDEGKSAANVLAYELIDAWRTIHVQDTAKVLEGLRR